MQLLSGISSNWYSYTGGDPVNNSDPTGYLTFQLGIEGSGNVGQSAGAVQIGAGVATNDSFWPGDWRLFTYASGRVGPGFGAGGGVTGAITGSFNKFVSDVEGSSITVAGGSVSLPGHGYGVEFTQSTDTALKGPDWDNISSTFVEFTGGFRWDAPNPLLFVVPGEIHYLNPGGTKILTDVRLGDFVYNRWREFVDGAITIFGKGKSYQESQNTLRSDLRRLIPFSKQKCP